MTAETLAPTVTGVLAPARARVANALLVPAGAGLVAAAAQVSVPLPFTPVPITAQTFAVLLVGASLGPLLGCASLVLYVAAGLAGAPVYAGGEGGLGVLETPTAGYLAGFVVAATLAGELARAGWDRRLSTAIGAMLSSSVVVYLFGLPWLAWRLGTDLERTLELGLYPFVAGDVVKLYLAAALLPAAWRLLERARGEGAGR